MDSTGKVIVGTGIIGAGAAALYYLYRLGGRASKALVSDETPSSIPTEMPAVEPQEALPDEALYQTPGDGSFVGESTAVEETPSEPATAPAPSAGLPPYSKDLLVKAVLALEKAPLADRNTLADDFGAALKQYTKPQQLEMLVYGQHWFTTLSAARQQKIYQVLVSAGMGPLMQQVYQAAQRRRAADQKAEEERAKNEAAAILKQQEEAKKAEESRKMAEQLAQQQAEQKRLEQEAREAEATRKQAAEKATETAAKVAMASAKDPAVEARQASIYGAMANSAAKFAISTIKAWKASTPQQRRQNTAQLFQMMKQLPAQYQRMAAAGYGRWWARQPASFKNDVLRTSEMQALIAAIQGVTA